MNPSYDQRLRTRTRSVFRRTGLVAMLLGILLSGCAFIHGTKNPAAVPEGTQATEVKYVPPPKIALVLGGGGARGFAHVGVIRVLAQEKIPIDLVVGTSVGSLIGAMYAANPDVFELEWKAFSLDENDLFDFSLLSAKKGPVKGEAIVKFVEKNVRYKQIERFPIPFIAVATDLNTGERVDIKKGDVAQAVRASVSIPGIFVPVTAGDRTLVDGGVVDNLAVDVARENGADIVIVSNITENVVGKEANDAISILLQSINIMMSKMAQCQLQDADVVITPAIGDVGTLEFGHKKRCMQEGIWAADEQLANIRKAIDAYYVVRGGLPPGGLSAPPVSTAPPAKTGTGQPPIETPAPSTGTPAK